MDAAHHIAEAISDQVTLRVQCVHWLYLNPYRPALHAATTKSAASAGVPNAALSADGPMTLTVVADNETFATDHEISPYPCIP